MHILYLHQYFAIPQGSTGTRSYEFAKRWVKAGHKVTVITGYADIGGLKVGNGLIQKQVIDQINVVVLNIKYSNKQSYFRRIMAFLCFIFLSIWIGIFIRRVDVIFATSTPLTIGVPAIALKWFKRAPFVFEVRDQWPQSVIELGIIKNWFLIKVLLWLEKVIYKYAAAIIAVSKGMADDICKIVRQKTPVHVIPNGADLELFNPSVDGAEIRERNNWNEKLVLLHAGAIGKTNDLDFLADAAEKLKEHTDILFICIGEGLKKAELQKRIERLELKNIELLASVKKQQLSYYLAAADVVLAVVGNYKIIEKHASLNKFYDGLSSGRPVLLNYSGWQGDVLKQYHAGFGCNQYDLNEFIEKVLYFHSHRDELAEMGRNARRAAEKEFDRDNLAQKALDVIVSTRTEK